MASRKCQPYWILITKPDFFMIVSACAHVKKTVKQTSCGGTSVPVSICGSPHNYGSIFRKDAGQALRLITKRDLVLRIHNVCVYDAGLHDSRRDAMRHPKRRSVEDRSRDEAARRSAHRWRGRTRRSRCVHRACGRGSNRPDRKRVWEWPTTAPRDSCRRCHS